MKVSEAQEKVCPFIQQASAGIDYLHMIGKTANIHCICGECMAWVWKKVRIAEYDGHPSFMDDSETEGYCSRIGNGV